MAQIFTGELANPTVAEAVSLWAIANLHSKRLFTLGLMSGRTEEEIQVDDIYLLAKESENAAFDQMTVYMDSGTVDKVCDTLGRLMENIFFSSYNTGVKLVSWDTDDAKTLLWNVFLADRVASSSMSKEDYFRWNDTHQLMIQALKTVLTKNLGVNEADNILAKFRTDSSSTSLT